VAARLRREHEPRGLALVPASLCLVLWTLSADAQPAADDPRMLAALRAGAQIELVVGAVDRHCGIYLTAPAEVLPEEWPAAASRREMRDALRCILDARKAGRSTWVLWQRPAIDSISFGGVAISAVSDPQVVSVGGRGGNASFRPCFRPRIDKGGKIACRNIAAPASERDLDRALARVKRDVSRTAGKTYDGVVARADEAAALDATRIDPGYLVRVVDEVQRSVQEGGVDNWPTCPRHHDHPLEMRDDRWFCGRDRAFIAPLGDLTRAGVKKPRAGNPE
jgi:hypothetical protein